MAKTTDELIIEVLDTLQRTSAGQEPAAEDRSLVAGAVGPLFEQLARMQVVYIPDHDSIDDAIFLPVALRLALQVGAKFGLPAMTPEQRIAADKEIILAQQQSVQLIPLKVDYY